MRTGLALVALRNVIQHIRQGGGCKYHDFAARCLGRLCEEREACQDAAGGEPSGQSHGSLHSLYLHGDNDRALSAHSQAYGGFRSALAFRIAW